MLDIIKKLDSNTVRGLIVATIPLLVLIGSLFGLDQVVFAAKLNEIGEKVIVIASLSGVAYAAYYRVFHANPPLTQKAVERTQAMLDAKPQAQADPIPTQDKETTE